MVAGTVLLVPLPDSATMPPARPTEVEVGWHLHPDSWGTGTRPRPAAGAIERGFAAGA